MIKLACFDMWGTLVEGGGEAQMDDLKKVIGAEKIPDKVFTAQVEESLLTHPWTLKEGMVDLAAKLMLPVPVGEREIEAGFKSWWGYVERVNPYPETEEVLRNLKKRGLTVAIVSNTDSQAISYKLNQFNLRRYFDQLFLSANLGVLKPDKRIFQAVEKNLNLSGKQILMVDDSLFHGVIPARKFGWRALWVARRKKGEDVGKIENLRGVLKYLYPRCQ